MSGIEDVLNAVTHAYIQRNSKKLVDGIFAQSPLMSWLNGTLEEEEPDTFLEYAAEIRREKELMDEIHGS